MAFLELLPTYDCRRAASIERYFPPEDAPAARPTKGGLLQFQLKRLIGEILAQGDLDPDLRTSLLWHSVKNPGSPERAMLAHLNAVHDPANLPPYKVCKNPPAQEPDM